MRSDELSQHDKQLHSLIDEVDIALINMAQVSIPIEGKPFLSLGKRLGVGEHEVLQRLERLKNLKLVRTISAIFDPSRLGYKTALVAFAADEERLVEVADIVSSQNFVSHNYERDAEFNLWFTVVLPEDEGMNEIVEALADACKVSQWLLLPTLRAFKVGVALDASLRLGNIYEQCNDKPMPHREIGDEDKMCVRILQDELPLVSKPFDELAGRNGVDGKWLIERALLLSDEGRLRRIAASVNHRSLGYTANALVVWDVSDEDVERAGMKLASIPQVSHCYQRPKHPDWHFSLYTMVHGTDESAVREFVETTAKTIRANSWRILFSKREFKKRRIKLFI